jgi:hypothetical protein
VIGLVNRQMNDQNSLVKPFFRYNGTFGEKVDIATAIWIGQEVATNVLFKVQYSFANDIIQ